MNRTVNQAEQTNGEVCVSYDPLSAEEITEIRKRYGLSQEAFGRKFGLPTSTIQKWEQGVAQPRASGSALLRHAAQLLSVENSSRA